MAIEAEAPHLMRNEAWNKDSVRFHEAYDYIWEEYLFSNPDSALILADNLYQDALARGTGFEGLALHLIAASYFVRGEMPTALEYFQKAFNRAEELDNKESMADAITNMGAAQFYMGHYSEALAHIETGIKIHEDLKDSSGIATDLNTIGAIYLARSDRASAADYFRRSLHLHEALGNTSGIASGLASLGSLYKSQSDYAAAFPYYEQAVALARKINDLHSAAKQLVELGYCSQELGDTTKAMKYYQESLAMTEKLDDAHGKVHALYSIGDLLLIQKKGAQAIAYYRQAIGIAEPKELSFGLGNALLGMGNALMLSGDYRQALEYAQRAEKAALDAEHTSLRRDVAELNYRVYKALGNISASLAQHELFMALNDSLESDENRSEVLRNLYQYGSEKKALADSLSHADVLLRDSMAHEKLVNKERKRVYFLSALGVILAMLALFIWSRSKVLKRTNFAILAAQEQLMESELQREAAEMRTRIASDIHDDMGGDLTKIALLSNEIRGSQIVEDPVVKQKLERIAQLSREASAALSEIVYAVDPVHDTASSLVEQAERLTKRMLEDTTCTYSCHFKHVGADRLVDPTTKHDLLLILKEALNNTVKYARAHNVAVSFKTDTISYELEVSDDGVGYDIGAEFSGNGIKNMKKRALRVNAVLVNESSVNNGSRILLKGMFS